MLQKLFTEEKLFLKEHSNNKELLKQKESEVIEPKQKLNEIDTEIKLKIQNIKTTIDEAI